MKLDSFPGWSMFFHHVRNEARKDPQGFKAFMDFSDNDSGTMPDTRAAERLKQDFAKACELGYEAASNQNIIDELDSLASRDYSFWDYVENRAASGKHDVTGVLKGGEAEVRVYGKFIQDVEKCFKMGARCYERRPKRGVSALKIGIIAGLVCGAISVCALTASHYLLKETVEDTAGTIEKNIDTRYANARKDFESAIDKRYVVARKELEKFVIENIPAVRKEAMLAVDEYFKQHPEMLYTPENTRIGVRFALRDIIKDKELMKELGQAIVKGMTGD
jgi:hypothetical protein